MPWWRTPAPAARRRDTARPQLPPAELARRSALGIRPRALAAQLRRVLPVGCAHDFTQTRAILGTGPARDQVDAAIQAVIAQGAHGDCEVFQALGASPRGVLSHHV